jgi:hypothetical protein
MEYCKSGTLSSMMESLWENKVTLPEEVIL